MSKILNLTLFICEKYVYFRSYLYQNKNHSTYIDSLFFQYDFSVYNLAKFLFNRPIPCNSSKIFLLYLPTRWRTPFPVPPFVRHDDPLVTLCLTVGAQIVAIRECHATVGAGKATSIDLYLRLHLCLCHLLLVHLLLQNLIRQLWLHLF